MKLQKNKAISREDFCKISRFRLIQMEIEKKELEIQQQKNKAKK